MALVEYIKQRPHVYCIKGRKLEGGAYEGMLYRVKMIGNNEQLLFIKSIDDAKNWEDLVAKAKSSVAEVKTSK